MVCYGVLQFDVDVFLSLSRCLGPSSLDAEITPDDPLFAFGNFSALVNHTIFTMSMQKGLSHFQVRNYRWRRCFAPARCIRIEHSLATLAACHRRCEVQQQSPSCFGRDGIR